MKNLISLQFVAGFQDIYFRSVSSQFYSCSQTSVSSANNSYFFILKQGSIAGSAITNSFAKKFFFAWNTNTPYFRDKRVRQAMSYAFNHQEMLDELCYGLYEASAGMWHPTSWMFPDAWVTPLFGYAKDDGHYLHWVADPNGNPVGGTYDVNMYAYDTLELYGKLQASRTIMIGADE